MPSRAWRLTPSLGLEGLRQIEDIEAAPGPGQILIAIRAVSLNYRDLLIAEGRYSGAGADDIVPASDAAGEVVAVGEGVDGFRPGDRVCPGFSSTWAAGPPRPHDLQRALGSSFADGVLRERFVCDAAVAVLVPEHLTFEEAACLPCAGVTAWNALHGPRPIRAGQTLLTLGLGGVSCFAIQFAKAAGVRVFSTSSSPARLETARRFGADAVINYRERTDWDAAVLELTQGRGVDHVVEVGGGGTLERSIASTAIDGQIHMIGVLTEGRVNPRSLIGWRTLRGVTVGSAADFRQMNRSVSHAGLRPVVDRVFDFEDAPSAYRYLRSGNHVGKVVIRVS